MKINPRHGKAAFSLIELMAVITIIVILAGLVVGGMGYITEKQAKSTAVVQIALISKTLEEYKSDFGAYPATVNSTDGLKNSEVLFKALYWDSDNDSQGAAIGTAAGDPDQKMYLPDLDPASNKQGWTTGNPSATTKITDPWLKEYRYRSALSPTGAANADTQNPDFDLWSSGKDGKSTSTLADKENRDDIKN